MQEPAIRSHTSLQQIFVCRQSQGKVERLEMEVERRIVLFLLKIALGVHLQPIGGISLSGYEQDQV